MQFDDAFKHYVQTEEFAEDKANGYGKWKVFWLKEKRGIKIPATQKTLQDFFVVCEEGIFNLEFLYPFTGNAGVDQRRGARLLLADHQTAAVHLLRGGKQSLVIGVEGADALPLR